MNLFLRERAGKGPGAVTEGDDSEFHLPVKGPRSAAGGRQPGKHEWSASVPGSLLGRILHVGQGMHHAGSHHPSIKRYSDVSHPKAGGGRGDTVVPVY